MLIATKEIHMARGEEKPLSRNSQRRNAKRNAIVERDGPDCWLCGRPIYGEEATLDHVKPAAEGGRGTLDNLKLAHSECNNARHNAPKKPL
jgi:5-methylcytosine-specific restriction endonuclease McrA